MDIKSFIGIQNKTHAVPRFPREYLIKYWEQVGKLFNPNYVLDELALKYIDYFCKEREDFYPILKQNPKKGLLVYGHKGVGKSLNFAIYRRLIYLEKSKLWQICNDEKLLAAYKDERFFHIEDIKDTEIEYKKNGVKHYETLNLKRELVIDDIGTEPLNIKEFGTDIDLVSDIMRLRYNLFQNGYCVTHITTNLNLQMIEERYGDRIKDRFNEMFIPILFKGESKRK